MYIMYLLERLYNDLIRRFLVRRKTKLIGFDK